MKDIEYIEQRRNSKKQLLRLRLGILQMIHRPLLNIFLVPIITGTVFIWRKKDMTLTLFDVPQILYPIYRYTIIALAVLLPILFMLTLIEAIGNMTARKDEANLQEAFEPQELRNGSPVLMDKKRIKGSNVTMREFYSNIPMITWIERQEEIVDSMNIHFVEKLKYGGKSNGKRIVMYTAQGRGVTSRGKLYDDEF
jgi:hypothetical protein